MDKERNILSFLIVNQRGYVMPRKNYLRSNFSPNTSYTFSAAYFTIKKVSTLLNKAPKYSWEYKFAKSLDDNIVRFGDKTRFSEKQLALINKYYDIYKNEMIDTGEIECGLRRSEEDLSDREFIVVEGKVRRNPKWKAPECKIPYGLTYEGKLEAIKIRTARVLKKY